MCVCVAWRKPLKKLFYFIYSIQTDIFSVCFIWKEFLCALFSCFFLFFSTFRRCFSSISLSLFFSAIPEIRERAHTQNNNRWNVNIRLATAADAQQSCKFSSVFILLLRCLILHLFVSMRRRNNEKNGMMKNYGRNKNNDSKRLRGSNGMRESARALSLPCFRCRCRRINNNDFKFRHVHPIVRWRFVCAAHDEFNHRNSWRGAEVDDGFVEIFWTWGVTS